MVDNVTMPGTEGIVASSQQQKIALEPATFYNDPLSERIAAVEPNTIKEAKEKKLRNDIAWKEYLSNPARMTDAVRTKEDYRKYRQIESMWRKPEYASIIDEYGSDMAVGGQMLADYVDWDKVSWWDKQVIGIRSARYGMKIGEARTKVAQLEHDGADQTQIDEAKAELARLEKYTVENSRPYESDTANAFASFGVSAARVIPEMLATSAAVALTAKTAGAAAPAAGLAATRLSMTLGSMFGKAGRAANIVRGLKTARTLERGSKYTTMAGKLTKELASGGAQASVIYGDTYRVTMGDLYQRIKDENPGISDERAYEMADTSATIQSAMESAPAFIGLGARAAITTELDTIVKSVLTKTPTDQIRRAAFIKYFQEEFNNGLGKRIAKGWAADTIVDTVTEVAQQASENATLKLAAEGGEGNVTAETFGRIGGFLLDPLNEEYDDELNTLLSVAPAAAVFGGVAPGIGYTANKASKGSVGSKISDAFRSNRFGEQLRNYTQEMTDKVGAETLKEQLRGMASRGDAPGTVRFDAAAIKEAVDTDPELRRAMDRLGVLKQINESQGNGGVIEVPIEEYNEVVNGEKSGVLYQKVKDMVSFRLDAMTMTELNEWIASTEAQNKKEMQEAIANERSVYNRMLNEYFTNPIFDRMTEGQKKANAALAQLLANRATRSLLSPMTAEEWFEKNVMFVTGEREGFGGTDTGLKQRTVIPRGERKETTIGGERNFETPHITVLERSDMTDLSMPTVIDFFVPEDKRGQGLGKQLLKQAIDQYGNLSGQVSSKKAAKIFYDMGGRLASNPNASLDDIYKVMDEQTSAFMTKTLDNEKQGDTLTSDTKGVQDEKRTKTSQTINAIRRRMRGGHDQAVWHDTSTGNNRTQKAEGVRSVNLDESFQKEFNEQGVSTPNFTVYDNAEVGAQEFLDAMKQAVAELGDQAASVDVKELSDYQGMKTLILSEDKKTGCAITQDGDIVSLFSSSSERGRTIPMLLLAVQNGGKKLDCFDIYLPGLYSKIGFKAIARNNWVEKYKPAGWDKKYFKKYNNGEPDVVFMVYDPNNTALYNTNDGELIKSGDVDADYGLGMQAQDNALKQIDAQVRLQKTQEGIKGIKNTIFQRQYQKDEEKIAGWFDVINGKYVIGLTDNWNATTFSHEVMHMYSRVLQDNYNNGTLSSYWKAQVEKLFNSVDAKPDTNGKYVLTDNQNELLAERFTTYLVDNEIKNPELNAIFAVLREAMRITYAESGRTKHQPDKKTKEAFAVIFGAYDVAVAEQQALGLLEIEKPEGVSQEAYDHYMSFLLESRAKSTHDMIKTYYAVEKYKKTKGYAKEYDETYTANLQAVEMEPRFKIKALAKQLGTKDVVTLLQAYNSVNGNALLTEDDVMAALNDTAEATQVAEARTAEMMEAKIREEFKIADGTTLVSKDMKNAAMAKAFLMEALMYEGKDWADFETEYRNLLDSVENEIQKMQLSKLQNSRRWNQLESLYALRYQGFASTGNKEKMAMVRRSQAQVVLIQNKMFEMNNRVDRFLEKFPKKLRTAQPQGQNTMSAESWDLLQSLMEKYGFKITDRRRSADPFHVKLDNWLKNIEASQYCPISNLRYFLPEVDRGHEGSFGSMTVRQFEVLEHVAIAINSVASREFTLVTESEKAQYDALAKITAERLKEKGIKPFDQNDSWWRKHFGILSNIVNPEPILKALFPEEVQRMLVRPFFSAAASAETAFNKWNDQWNNMIKDLNLSNTKKQYSTGNILSYNDVANLLLAMGNEHSYENWRLFLHLDEAQAETIIAEALAEQPGLAKFANAYWAMMAETTDIMNKSYRQRYNKLFVKKQARSFKIGEYEFTGGYVPETKLVSELTDTDGWESIIMGELSNEKLLSDKPDGQDLQSIIDHTRNRLHLFARWGYVAPAFNNLVRFVQREDVGLAIGTRAQGYLKGWLRDYHTPAGDSAGLMHALMSATTTTVLGIRLPQALLQLSGVIPAMNILGRGGIRYMASALGHTLAEGKFHQVERARTGKSAYMKARYADPVKTLFGVSKTEAHISQTMDKFQKLAMSMISYMDAIVSNATWEASYRMSIDNGLSEMEAIEKADQDVRLSQTDSMTASRAKAMKSDWARIITPFSTYIMGMQSVVRGKIAEKEYYGAFTFALSYIAISTFFEAMLKEMTYPWDDDDDKNYIEKVLLRWYNDTVSTAGSTLYPIANLGSYATETFAYATEKLIDPDEKTWISMYGAGSLAALNYAKQYPDAVKYGLIGIFNGDEDAQRKAVANFVGWFSAGGKRLVKDLMED